MKRLLSKISAWWRDERSVLVPPRERPFARGTVTQPVMYEQVELKDGKCPDCGGDKYWEGPSGGACTNICCSTCFSAFNIGPGWGERIPNTYFKSAIERAEGERQSWDLGEVKPAKKDNGILSML